MTEVSKQVIMGLVIIFLGFFLLFDSLGYIEVDFWSLMGDLWPLVLIVIGLIVVFKGSRKTKHEVSPSKGKYSNNSISGLFGDVRIAGMSDTVGKIDRSLIIGDIVIDLSGSKLQDGDDYVGVSVIFGDVVVTVPADFPVSVDLSCIAGSASFGDKKSDGLMPKILYTENEFGSAPAKLYIKGNAIFGDVKVIKSTK
jgi:predicted membrane protein